MLQSGLTIITEVIPEKVDDLKALLNSIGDDINDNELIDFSLMRSVHFLRFVVLDAQQVNGRPVPPQLALSTNYDGPLRAHLLEMATQAQQGLTLIYSHCKGFSSDQEPQKLARFLYRHKQKNAAFYQSTMGRSVTQVEQESELNDAIQTYLQNTHPAQNWEGRSVIEIRKEIQSHILSQPQFDWVKKPYKKPFLQQYGTAVLAFELLALLILYVLCWAFFWLPTLLMSLVIFLGLFIFWQNLKKLEARDNARFRPSIKNIEQVSQLNQREDYKVQNQLTHLVNVKGGITRQIALRVILGAINLLAGTFYNKGELAGIVTIHFARWAFIDGGKRLLFFSNFDGSWESYLGEFVDRAAIGLTGVWCNTVGFPPTTNLVGEGARHSVEFKSWAREKQIETQVWYSARKTLSVKNINNNTAIRQGLIGEMNEKEAIAWLKRL